MVAEVLIDQLHSQGLTISADGDRLLVAPSSGLTDDLRAAIRQHKSELLEVLSLSRTRACETLNLSAHTDAASNEPEATAPQHFITIRASAMPKTCPLCEEGEPAHISGNLWRCPACSYRFELAGPDPEALRLATPARPAPMPKRICNLTVNAIPAQCPACDGAVNLQDKVTAWCAACRISICVGVVQ